MNIALGARGEGVRPLVLTACDDPRKHKTCIGMSECKTVTSCRYSGDGQRHTEYTRHYSGRYEPGGLAAAIHSQCHSSCSPEGGGKHTNRHHAIQAMMACVSYCYLDYNSKHLGRTHVTSGY